MRRKPTISSEDRTAFLEATKDVRPLINESAEIPRPPPPPRPYQTLADERQVLVDLLSDGVEDDEFETGEELLYARPGLQHSVLRKLRRGQYSVGAALDLHGLTVAEARPALARFLQQSQLNQHRCVRVIHGKGNRSKQQRPVLKGKVDHWLRQWESVMAFCSARPMDGGTGAVYILLRSAR